MDSNLRKRVTNSFSAAEAGESYRHFDDDDDKPKRPVVSDVEDDQDFLVRYEKYVPWVVLLMSFATRYYRLFEPPGMLCIRRVEICVFIERIRGGISTRPDEVVHAAAPQYHQSACELGRLVWDMT